MERPMFPRRVGLVVLAVAVVASIAMCTGNNNDREPSPRTTSTSTTTSSQQNEPRDINASVRFDGSQFTITNNEDRDWVNVRFEVNPGLISSGYTLKVQRVEANTTYTVGAMQFTKADGERFNPFTHRPQTFNIIDFSTAWPSQYDIEGFASFGWQ